MNAASSVSDLIHHRFTRLTLLFFILIGLILVMAAGLRPSDGNPDLNTYREWYFGNFTLTEYLANPAFIFIKDPGYFLITSISRDLGLSFELFIFIFSLICVSLKMKGIGFLSNAPFYSVLIYISSYFLLQEVIQIRAGIASGFFLLSIPFLAERKYIKYSSLILLAMCFHYSAIVLLPLVCLTSKSEHPNYYLAFLLISILCAVAGLTLDAIIVHFSWIDSRVVDYITNSENDFKVNIFNRVSLLDLVLCVTLLINFEKLKNITPYASYVIRIFTISQIIFYSLSGFAVFAFRLSELMGVVEIIAWPLLLPLLKPSKMRIILFIAVSIIFFTATLRNFNK